ncbi:hypothetical protein BH23VER1_BH23VER1_27220 [soil metagenome]
MAEGARFGLIIAPVRRTLETCPHVPEWELRREPATLPRKLDVSGSHYTAKLPGQILRDMEARLVESVGARDASFGFEPGIRFGMGIRHLVALAECCGDLEDEADEDAIRQFASRLGGCCLHSIPWLIERFIREDSELRNSFGISQGLLLVAAQLRRELDQPAAGLPEGAAPRPLQPGILAARGLLAKLRLPVAAPVRQRVEPSAALASLIPPAAIQEAAEVPGRIDESLLDAAELEGAERRRAPRSRPDRQIGLRARVARRS